MAISSNNTARPTKMGLINSETNSGEEDGSRYGWEVKLDHEFACRAGPLKMIRMKQIPSLLSTFARYSHWRTKKEVRGIKAYIDIFDTLGYSPIHGVPLGGIGSGSITRGYRGDFTRFQLIPGRYEYNEVLANQFLVTIRRRNKTVFSQVLSPLRPKGRGLSSWEWSMHGSSASYRALYPRAFTTYELPGQPIKLICEQISPVIPNNYKDSCFPMATFIWKVVLKEGVSILNDPIDVTITFVFQNGRGSLEDKRGGGVWNKKFSSPSGTTQGVLLHNSVSSTMPLTFAVAAKSRNTSPSTPKSGVPAGPMAAHAGAATASTAATAATAATLTAETSARRLSRNSSLASMAGQIEVTSRVGFDPDSPATEIWDSLMEKGSLEDVASEREARPGQHIACAVAAKLRVSENQEENEIEFSLCWDMPNVQFGSKQLTHRRRYTRWFSRRNNPDDPDDPDYPVIQMSRYAMANWRKWRGDIEAWQSPVLEDPQLPDWFKSAVFNELYYLADGGTVWLETETVPFMTEGKSQESKDDIRKEYGRFGYLEGHEYRMYNTYDVHFYSSFALIDLWPYLQLSVNYDFCDTIDYEDGTPCKSLACGDVGPVKALHSVPHDLGNPADEPWLRTNCYNMHLTQDWRDLNLKFVLQSYRDFAFTGHKTYIQDMWPKIEMVMAKAKETQDSDDDGMIENSGQADQTYDAWRVKGVSSYCGGLWVASLRVCIELLNNPSLKLVPPELRNQKLDYYENLCSKAAVVFDTKLWNGKYFNYDSSTSGHHDSIMADQLCGWYYLVASGLEANSPFVEKHAQSALSVIYENNVMKYENGSCGAVNGMRPNGAIDLSSPQSEEVWTGVTYALAALMIYRGMHVEGFATAGGMYRTLWEDYGLQFQTPEAFMKPRNVWRSLAYMRPLSIWSMKLAWDRRNERVLATSEGAR